MARHGQTSLTAASQRTRAAVTVGGDHHRHSSTPLWDKDKDKDKEGEDKEDIDKEEDMEDVVYT